MSSKNEFSLKEAITEWMNRSPMRKQLQEAQVIEAYKKAVGEILFKKTKEISSRDGKLYLKFDSAPLRAELFSSRQDLLEQINASFGKPVVMEIVFR
jgi:hypothetical protein